MAKDLWVRNNGLSPLLVDTPLSLEQACPIRPNAVAPLPRADFLPRARLIGGAPPIRPRFHSSTASHYLIGLPKSQLHSQTPPPQGLPNSFHWLSGPPFRFLLVAIRRSSILFLVARCGRQGMGPLPGADGQFVASPIVTW